MIMAIGFWFFLVLAVGWGWRACTMHYRLDIVGGDGSDAALIGLLCAAIAIALRMPVP